MQITLPQIKAARALLGWNSDELARQAGVNPDQIRGYESGRTKPSDVGDAIFKAFTAAGLIFPNGGVQPAPTTYTVEGPAMYLDLLVDVQRTGVKDVIIENADERLTPPEIVEKFRELNKDGITVRMTIEERNTFMMHDVRNYRMIPKKHFQNWVIMTYGPKVAMVVSSDPKDLKAIVINQEKLADAMRNRFALVWDLLPTPDVESTAHERIL